ncbi:hypothetical protein [Gordonia rubripertincta]|uniref:hypothetical protein n=1 Tax=Gordonia rubripertincta TaxID=36822 RepID=UPI0015F90416|nr:hypothetical protein [Gordonia rubripertincta]QMU22898.1 hypothetical protein H3V45_10710 [Gordonia rubripertincta]
MTSTIPHFNDNAPTTTLTCEHCAAQVVAFDDDPTAMKTWDNEHAKCSWPAGTRVIKDFEAELPTVGDPLEANRPTWSDPLHDVKDEAAPLFSQWLSEVITIDHPRSRATDHFSARIRQMVDQASPVVQLWCHEVTEDGGLIRDQLFAVPTVTARQIAAALNLLADLADESEVAR